MTFKHYCDYLRVGRPIPCEQFGNIIVLVWFYEPKSSCDVIVISINNNRKPRETAAVLFGIQCTRKISQRHLLQV